MVAGDKLLIAICLERLGDHPLFAPPFGLCKQAFIRGVSAESSASFRFETCPLPPAHLERFERLREHGFTVMVAPSDWRYKYPPHKWHDELIVEAVNKVEKFPHEQIPSKPSGYNHELARAVMEALNEAFPHSLALIDLKYQFRTEPSDIVLSSVLNALRGDGFIDGAKGFQNTSKLNPLEQIKLTAEGRRHLEEEMKKGSKPQRPYSGNDATEFILQQLLSEFRERHLTTTDLHRSYKGLSPSELTNRSLAAGIIEVDFDLAMSELENHGLVKTGPMAAYDNPPGSFVTMIGLYSKREYSYLTENGYKEAVKCVADANRHSKAESTSDRGRTVFHGDQYNVFGGQVAAIGPHSNGTINVQQQWTAIQNEIDLNALTGELEQLRKHLQQSASSSFDYQQLALLSEAEEHAKKRDGRKAMEVLSKVGKGALGVAKDIGTEIAAKVIAKSMGLEP